MKSIMNQEKLIGEKEIEENSIIQKRIIERTGKVKKERQNKLPL